MKKLIFAGVGALALIGAMRPTAAADIPISPYRAAPAVMIFSWTGFYIGAHAGGGWARKDMTAVPFTLAGATIAAAPVAIDLSGWLAGGQIGVNYQEGAWVFGACAGHDRGPAGDRFRSPPALRQGRRRLGERQI